MIIDEICDGRGSKKFTIRYVLYKFIRYVNKALERGLCKIYDGLYFIKKVGTEKNPNARLSLKNTSYVIEK